MEIVVSGLAAGGLFALVAQGFVLTFLTTNTLNFALGEFMVVAAFLALAISSWGWLPSAGKIVFVIAVFGVLGAWTYRLIVLPFSSGHNDTRWLLSTVGLSFIIINMTTNGEGVLRQPLNYGGMDEVVEFLGVRLPSQQGLIAVTAVLVTIALVMVTRMTGLGTRMRAVSEDAEAASLMGISSKRIGMIAYGLAMSVVALAGVLWAAEVGVSPQLGEPLLVGAFAAGIIGGLTSLWGPLLGGGIYGLVTAAVGESAGVMWGEVSGLLIVLAVLMFRPEGLLGRRVDVKL
ncbi:branched-chain amino acid ABC transporter permease [Rhodococcus sp. IEGM 1307]|uniref:branched-chain amino acid ABC transporter permease n=1 Tax=Rhodococcus sp. IEGM 1307 TaxID=3047091 RepID=UPI0024B7D14C|nr:branched-chain amino acid ABC transporter permease [Rhodococcus sp. IEGM 1307]MDI9977398.1 branched-chain amino acid ABC transporter permease [Rhodococcus sp. IEGM 1307]